METSGKSRHELNDQFRVFEASDLLHSFSNLKVVSSFPSLDSKLHDNHLLQ